MYVASVTNFLTLIFTLTVFFQICLAVDTPPPPSLHAPLLDQVPDATSGESSHATTSSHNPPMKISTGRMRPVTSPGSPRYTEALAEAGIGRTKFAKSLAHVGILGTSSEHLYPKISVEPGKKDSTVVSFFHHAKIPQEGAKPYDYMQHQNHDFSSDISKPAMIYKIGLRKPGGKNSKDFQHMSQIVRHMGRNQYHPKAALLNTVRGDSRATHNKPKIDVDPGRLNGNLITTLYTPASPRRDGNVNDSHQNQPRAGNVAGGSRRSQSPPRNRTRARSNSPDNRGDHRRQRVD